MRTKYYFTVKEIFDNFNYDWTEMSNTYAEQFDNIAEEPICIRLLNNYILPRCRNGILYISNDELVDYDDLCPRMLSWLSSSYSYYSKLISLYEENESKLMDRLTNTTTHNLTTTLTGGNTNKFDAGKMKTTNRENDTPQNGGDWSDDAHTSSINVNESDSYTNTYKFTYDNQKHLQTGTISVENDPTTIIDRLTEIKKKYEDLYYRWVRDFEKNFVYYPSFYEEKRPDGYYYYEN